jgi:hypothetical protein
LHHTNLSPLFLLSSFPSSLLLLKLTHEQLLTFRLIEKCDDALKADVIKWSAFYEHRLHIGSKVIFHLEAFVAKFMRILEGYLMGMADF